MSELNATNSTMPAGDPYCYMCGFAPCRCLYKMTPAPAPAYGQPMFSTPFWVTEKPCEHCYCIPHKTDRGKRRRPHRECCKCGEYMAEEFVGGECQP